MIDGIILELDKTIFQGVDAIRDLVVEVEESPAAKEFIILLARVGRPHSWNSAFSMSVAEGGGKSEEDEK